MGRYLPHQCERLPVRDRDVDDRLGRLVGMHPDEHRAVAQQRGVANRKLGVEALGEERAPRRRDLPLTHARLHERAARLLRRGAPLAQLGRQLPGAGCHVDDARARAQRGGAERLEDELRKHAVAGILRVEVVRARVARRVLVGRRACACGGQVAHGVQHDRATPVARLGVAALAGKAQELRATTTCAEVALRLLRKLAQSAVEQRLRDEDVNLFLFPGIHTMFLR